MGCKKKLCNNVHCIRTRSGNRAVCGALAERITKTHEVHWNYVKVLSTQLPNDGTAISEFSFGNFVINPTPIFYKKFWYLITILLCNSASQCNSRKWRCWDMRDMSVPIRQNWHIVEIGARKQPPWKQYRRYQNRLTYSWRSLETSLKGANRRIARNDSGSKRKERSSGCAAS